MAKTKPLTAKQKAFIKNYTNAGSATYNNATQSAIKAGYSERSANNNLPQIFTETVVKAIEEARQEQAKKTDVTAEEIVQELRSLAFKQDQEGMVNNGERIRALELLGKYKAMFTDKVQTSTADQSSTMTDTEKEAFAEASRQASIKLAQ